MSGNVVSELVLKFTGDTSNAIAAIGAMDSKMAASAKNYVSALGNIDNSLARTVAAHPVAAAGIAAVGVALVYVGVQAVQAAASYDKQTVSLQNSAKISSASANQIGTAFLQTAGNSTFSASEIMGAYAPVAGMLGNVEGHALSNKEAMQIMSAAQALAEGTGQDLGTTTSSLSQIMKDYHLNTGQAGQASNDLFNLQRLTGNSTDSLTTAFNRLQPVVAGTNISVDQSSGFMLEMTTAFGSGRKAIGLVGTTLQAMSEPSSAAKKALQGVGISLTDANGKFIGLGPALDAFKRYMDSGATATQKNALMQSVFGKNADDMKKIVEGGSAALAANTQKVTGNNEVGKAAAANADTLAGKQKTLSAALKDVEIMIGQALIPVVSTLMSWIVKIVTPIAEWVTHNKLLATVIAGMVIVVVGLTVAIAAITVVVGVFSAAFAALTTEVIVFDAAILPVWAVIAIGIAVIAAVIAIIVLLYKNWSTIWGAMTDIWNGFYRDVIQPIIHAFDLIPWAAVWNGILLVLQGIWEALKTIATTEFQAIQAVIQVVWDAISTVTTTVWNAISGTLQTIWNALTTAASAIFTGIANVIETIWNTISAVTSTIWNAIVAVVTGIWNAFSATAAAIFTAIQNIIQGIWNNISAAASLMWNSITAVVGAIWDAFKLAATTVFTGIQNIIQGIWDNTKAAATTMWNAITAVVGGIWDTFKNSANTVFTGIQNIIQGIWDNINGAAKTMWNAIVTTISTAWDGIKKVVAEPINAVIVIANKFIDGANTVLGKVGVPAIPDIPGPIAFATGGQVPGGWGGGDTVPAMLTPGERVLSTRQVGQMGGHKGIDNMLGMAHGGRVPGVQYFDSGGIVSGGMSNGAFHGSWKDSVNGVTYTDIPGQPGTQVSAQDLTDYVSGANSPVKGPSGISQVAGAVGAVASAGVDLATGGLGALVGLGEVFIKGALVAAATAFLAPLKLAVDHLPETPVGYALGKGTAQTAVKGIYNFITRQDAEKGIDPVATSIGGVALTPAIESAALAYAEATFAGLPYTWGNNDCSGIVQKAYSHVGVSLPRVSSEQYRAATPVTDAQAIPGDLAFYNPGESGAPAGLPGHVGFYAGNSKIFDAYNTSRPIGFDPLSLPGNTYMGIRRPGSGAGSSGVAALPPGNLSTLLAEAAAASGVPLNIVTRQIQLESGFNANAVSPTGAQGIAQFEPGTWATYGSGSPFDPAAAMTAYAKYMKALLAEEGGDIFKALEAYNAGPGNLAAGASYANTIMGGGGTSSSGVSGGTANAKFMHAGGIVGYSVGGMADGLIRVGENGPETIDLGGRESYVHRNGSGPSSGIDYAKLAAAMQANQGVTIENMNVTQADAKPSDIVDEFNWHLRVARLGVQ